MINREFAGSAAELHALPMPTELQEPEMWVMRPRGVALVMGSSQKPEMFDTEQLRTDGVELAERRSGGGAVFIDPAEVVWIDALLPRTSSEWSHELTETFLTVGRRWQRALAALGIEANLCEESPVRTPEAKLACWAGTGWGELTLAGAKLVGLSQRRTRWGARVQAMAVLGSSSARVAAYVPEPDRASVAAAIPTTHQEILARHHITPQALETAVLAAFLTA